MEDKILLDEHKYSELIIKEIKFHELEDRIDKLLEYIKINIVDFDICTNIQDYERIEVEVHNLKSLINLLKGNDL